MRKYLLMLTFVMNFNLGAIENASFSSDSKIGEFVWNELATTEVQTAKEFYSKVFGWEFIDKKMDNMTYTVIKKGTKEFGGIWEIPVAEQNQIPPHWLAYILVENVKQSLETARKNGAKIIKPIQKAGEMGLFAIIQDPTGAHIALWQSLKK